MDKIDWPRWNVPDVKTIIYQFTLTDLARAFIEAHASNDAVFSAVGDKLNEAGATGEHFVGVMSFVIGGQLFAAIGYGNGLVVIDTATYVDHGVLDSGPFKGNRVIIATPDTPGREE